MYSEMIAFLDRNTVQYMVEDMTNQLSVLKKTNEELETQTKELESHNKDLESQNKDLLAEVERLRNLVQTDET
jgi:cell division protein FtsB